MNRRRFNALTTQALLSWAAMPHCAVAAAQAKAPRLSVMLWTLEKLASFDRCLELVAEAGYQGVELVGEFHSWSPDRQRDVLKRLERLGLVVDAMSGVKAGFAVADDAGLFLSQFQAQIAAAQSLGRPQIILLSGPGGPAQDPQRQRQAALENLRRAAEMAAKAQLEVLIEPIDPLESPGTFLQTVTQGFDLVRAVGQPNLKVLFDLYHEQRAFGNLIEKLENNIEQVGLIHVADVPGRHEPGTGEIHFNSIYRKLAELRYHRWIAMEFYPTGNPVADLRTARAAVLSAYRG